MKINEFISYGIETIQLQGVVSGPLNPQASALDLRLYDPIIYIWQLMLLLKFPGFL